VSDLFSDASNGFKTKLQESVRRLARNDIFIGTSSWKYPGWCGQFYDAQRYCYRGKFSEKRFEAHCLSEYAETFKTVCVDAAYYQFPSERYLTGLVQQVPADFQFSFKVTDDITLKRFGNLPRFGLRAGQLNPDFLNVERFISDFLQPCERFRSFVGVLMFEFSHFYAVDFASGREFVAALERFLSGLPKDWRYGVEIRNPDWLQPEYFAVLRQHGVAHVYNNWQAMPTVSEQLALAGSETTDALAVARFLLKPGRKYAEAVKEFSPYKAVKEINPDARAAGVKLINQARQKAKTGFIYVNNRLEGNALETIKAMAEASG
jgi:uncharacterized protein YecE (DUF72 family)